MKNSKKILILLIIGLVPVGLIGCGKATKENVIQNLESDNYKSLKKDYEKLNDSDRKIVNKKLEEKMELIVEDFKEIGYSKGEYSKEDLDETINKINLLRTAEYNDYGIDRVIDKLNELYDVAQEGVLHYKTGMEYFNKKEYEKSLDEFKKISTGHPIYEKTKKSI